MLDSEFAVESWCDSLWPTWVDVLFQLLHGFFGPATDGNLYETVASIAELWVEWFRNYLRLAGTRVNRKRLIQIAVLVLVISAGLVIVSRRRPLPLSPTEERFVGTWDYNEYGFVRNRLTFFPDRTATKIQTDSLFRQEWDYTWYVESGSLFVTRRQPPVVFSTSGITMAKADVAEYGVKFRSDNQVVIGRWIHDRQSFDQP